MTSLREKLIKIGAKVVSHGRYVTFQLAEVAVGPTRSCPPSDKHLRRCGLSRATPVPKSVPGSCGLPCSQLLVRAQ